MSNKLRYLIYGHYLKIDSKPKQLNMKTICKFECSGVERGSDGAQISLEAVTSGSVENENFFVSTPNGILELSIVNPEAAEMFEIGKEYYIEISQA